MTVKKAFQYILIIAITALLIIFIKKNLHQIKQVLKIKPSFLLILVFLNIASKTLLGLKIKKIAGIFKNKLPFISCFGSVVINNFYNYLAPKSGTVMAGVYLKQKHNFDYKKYVSLIISTFTITILSSGIIGSFASIYAYKKQFINNFVFLYLFLAMILGALVLFFIPKIHLSNKNLMKKINEYWENWHILRRDAKSIMILATIDIAVILLMSVRYFILFRMFSLNVIFISCILLAPFNILVHVSTIIPGAYGIKEAVMGFLSKFINVDFFQGVLVTLGERVVAILVTFILGPIFSLIMFKHIFVSKTR